MASPVLNEPAPANVFAFETGDMLYTSPILKIELLPSEMTWTTPTIAGMDYTLFIILLFILCTWAIYVSNLPVFHQWVVQWMFYSV
jgi:hypothetical protein